MPYRITSHPAKPNETPQQVATVYANTNTITMNSNVQRIHSAAVHIRSKASIYEEYYVTIEV